MRFSYFVVCLSVTIASAVADSITVPALWGVEMDGNATASTPLTGPLTNSFSSGGFVEQTGYLNSTGSNSSGTILDPIQNVLYNFSAQSSIIGNVELGNISGGLIANAGGLHVVYCGLEICQTDSSTADSSLSARWFDTLVFGGEPLGTPEYFTVTTQFLSTLSGATYPSGYGAAAVYSLTLGHCDIQIQVNETTPPPSLDSVQTCVLEVLSGDTLRVDGELNMDAIGTTLYGLGYSSSASISALDPAFFLDPITPGATYTSASGVSYASVSPIPEPGGVFLIGFAMVVTLILRRPDRRRLTSEAVDPSKRTD
jgi:hypothetical protein